MTPASANGTTFNYAAVIFDMDGLLLDTERLYTVCFQQMFSEWDLHFDVQLKGRLMGLSARATAELCVRELRLPVGVDEFMRRAKELQMEAFKQCELMPGAREVVELLAMRGVRMAVATSSLKTTYVTKIAPHRELFQRFAAVVNGDDPAVMRTKPAPDIFLVAAQRLDVQPEDCLAFEDSPNGVRAALAAGMTVVWIPDPALDHRTAHADLYEHPRVTLLSLLTDFGL